MSLFIALLLAGQATVTVAPAQTVTASLSLDRVEVGLVDRDRLRVALHAAPLADIDLPPVRAQHFLLADVPVPVTAAAAPVYGARETLVTFEVDLKAVPEGILGIPFDRVPVRWEGRDGGGSLVLAAMGEIHPNDRGRLAVPAEELAKTYARLEDARVTPGLTEVAFRGLLRLYNPFSFDVVVTRFDYEVKVGTETLMKGVRPGFRLRPRAGSDVLLEQSASVADVAAGVVGAVIGGKPVSIDGTIVLRAPTGEQAVPVHLAGGF